MVRRLVRAINSPLAGTDRSSLKVIILVIILWIRTTRLVRVIASVNLLLFTAGGFWPTFFLRNASYQCLIICSRVSQHKKHNILVQRLRIRFQSRLLHRPRRSIFFRHVFQSEWMIFENPNRFNILHKFCSSARKISKKSKKYLFCLVEKFLSPPRPYSQ